MFTILWVTCWWFFHLAQVQRECCPAARRSSDLERPRSPKIFDEKLGKLVGKLGNSPGKLTLCELEHGPSRNSSFQNLCELFTRDPQNRGIALMSRMVKNATGTYRTWVPSAPHDFHHGEEPEVATILTRTN